MLSEGNHNETGLDFHKQHFFHSNIFLFYDKSRDHLSYGLRSLQNLNKPQTFHPGHGWQAMEN